jgi:sugar/nucleoside kinase (ribokinase family)
MEVYFAGVVGNDEYGKRIKEEFESVNVNTKYLEFSNEFSTTNSFIVVNRENGSRTSFAHRNKKMAMKEIELDFEPDIILFDGQEVDMTNKLLDRYPNAISIIDAGRPTEDIIKLAKRVNYLVCSKEFSENVSNIKINNDGDYLKVYNYMKNEFKNEVIITLEEKGCLYLYEDKIKIMPSLKVEAVDTTGAGDIFHGAFTYCIANNFSLEKTLKIANITGALSVTKIGSKNSIPEKEDIKKYEEDFR